MKYEWTLAGNKVGNGDRLISVPVYKNGSYVLCVKVTDTCNHCDTTICVTKSINCSGLNINNQLYKQQIALYPNPANDLIHMDWVGETLGNNNLHFDVYDIVGHIISEGKLNQGSNIIATSVWSNGVYFVRVFTSEGERTMRVIISR